MVFHLLAVVWTVWTVSELTNSAAVLPINALPIGQYDEIFHTASTPPNIGATGPKHRFAFLVIDMQEKFRPMITDKMIKELNDTIALCRRQNIPVIFTLHGHRYMEWDTGVMGEFWKHDLALIGDASWQQLPELDVQRDLGDIIVDEKRRYDAFFNTPLESILRWKKVMNHKSTSSSPAKKVRDFKFMVDTVIIGGVMTNLCCETTARSAFNRDYRVVFLKDGTATVNQELQTATLKNIEYGFGRVPTCKQLRDEILPKEAVNFQP